MGEDQAHEALAPGQIQIWERDGCIVLEGLAASDVGIACICRRWFRA